MSISKALLNFYSSRPQKIFLTDGIGALLSALLLLLIAYFEELFGMPRQVLFQLVLAPILFATFSFGCYFINPIRWKRYLFLIAIANGLYCLVTLVLILYNHDALTMLGIIYFLLEIIVVAFLATLELHLAGYKRSMLDKGSKSTQ